MGKMPIGFAKLKRFTVIAAALSVPAMWNACGKVNFTEQKQVAKGADCSDPAADPNACPQPSSFQPMSQLIPVNSSNKDVDILFVVDNSGSMAEEQRDIGAKIGGFLDKIKDLNWQIAVTTTDPNGTTKDGAGVSRPWGDGQLRPFDSDSGSQYILKQDGVSLPADLQSKLAFGINVGIKGNGNERGINATYRAVERAADASVNKDFVRPNARLAVVVISDEDECSTGLGGCPSGAQNSSTPANLVNKVKDVLGTNKVFSFNSIMWIPGDTTCTTGENQGRTYEELTMLTGGLKGSVCSTDFTTPLSDLGKAVVDLVKTVNLDCAPEDINGDGKPDVKVTLALGTIMTSGFQVNGRGLTFDNALPDGYHKFEYHCRK